MLCSVEGCGKPLLSRGLCNKHYKRFRKDGSLKTIIAPRGSGHTLPAGYVMRASNYEHVAVAEHALGRPLPPKAIVHHVDHDCGNNAPTNLVICPDQKYHKLLHQRERALEATGNPNARTCNICRKWDVPANLRIYGKRVVHKDCDNAQRRETHRKARERNS